MMLIIVKGVSVREATSVGLSGRLLLYYLSGYCLSALVLPRSWARSPITFCLIKK
jgi:hypothetical protein